MRFVFFDTFFTGDLPVDLDDDNTPPPLPRVEDEGRDEIEILDEIFNTFLQDWPLPPSSGMNVLLHMQSLLDTRCHDEGNETNNKKLFSLFRKLTEKNGR